MRSADQISRSASDWQKEQKEQRERSLRAFLSTVAAARAHGEPWVEWIDAGCPELTREQYQATAPSRGRGRRSARSGARS